MKKLSNADVLKKTELLAAEERKITAVLLIHLREVERRRLHAELGYGSLFEFTVKHLKFSEGAASRRIAAMRLLRDCVAFEGQLNTGSPAGSDTPFSSSNEAPLSERNEMTASSEMIQALENGSVNVSTLSALQTFFKEKERQEGRPVSTPEKVQWSTSSFRPTLRDPASAS